MPSESANENFWTPELSPEEKALRVVFVDEYLKDYDPVLAAIRIGFQLSYAKEYSARFITEPYTQKLIQEARLNISSENDVERDKNLIIQTLREAAQHGPYASRVNAAKGLAEIRGLHKQVIDEDLNLINALRDFAQAVK